MAVVASTNAPVSATGAAREAVARAHFPFPAAPSALARAFGRARLQVAAGAVGIDVGVVVLAGEDERAAEGPLLRAVVAAAAAERPFAAAGVKWKASAPSRPKRTRTESAPISRRRPVVGDFAVAVEHQPHPFAAERALRRDPEAVGVQFEAEPVARLGGAGGRGGHGQRREDQPRLRASARRIGRRQYAGRPCR